MGRAKILWTSPRSIMVTATGVTIQYRIPVCEEKGFMGEFKEAIVKDGVLIVNYSATDDVKGIKEPPIIFEKIDKIISFN